MFRRKITASFALVVLALALGPAASAAPNKPARTPTPAAPDRADKGERAVVFDDRYRPPAKDLLLSPGQRKEGPGLRLFHAGLDGRGGR